MDAWKEFRDAKAERDRDEDGILHCQDWKIGLPRCGYGYPELDLHHVNGRDGELLFDETQMVWLTRKCHTKAHKNIKETRNAFNSNSTNTEAPYDAARQVD